MINEMKRKARGAPKSNQVKIDTLLDLYHIGQLNNKRTLENAIIALTYPGLFQAKALYHKATGQFIKKKAFPYKLEMEYTLKVL